MAPFLGLGRSLTQIRLDPVVTFSDAQDAGWRARRIRQVAAKEETFAVGLCLSWWLHPQGSSADSGEGTPSVSRFGRERGV